MRLTEYVLLPREERTRHIDLSSSCELVPKSRWARSKDKHCDFHEVTNDVENWIEGKVQRCHLCHHGATTGVVCVNPLHFYIGNPQENRLDVPFEIRSEGSKGPKSEEAKKNIRAAALKKPPISEETRAKLSAAKKLQVQTEATKQKRSKSLKQWWHQRNYC